ncbi:MAG: alpha-amylase [Paraglaciecola sp.]|jgi:glycosidase
MKTLALPLKAMLLLLAIISITSCNSTDSTQHSGQNKETTMTKKKETLDKPRVPEWHKNANIYEVNLRQYTAEGTYKAFTKHLPRLKAMGVDLLWFMPVNPISVKKRKGTMGSNYAVADYKKSNPEFGSLDDFREMMKAIHDQGMYGIIDWVPNHTGWDNPWIAEHPEWFTQDKDGNVIDPIDPETEESWGWTDVADLNFDNMDMRAAMIDAMAFWVTECNVDGFRCDVAHNVPVDFWATAADSLYAIRPLYMLAEAEVPAIVNNGAFVVDYAWEFHHLLNDIAKSQGANRSSKKLVKGNIVEGSKTIKNIKTALDIDEMIAKKREAYTKGYQMNFTSNHDENAWSGTEMARFGDGHLTFAVLTATLEGTSLVYSGQESAMDKQLEFFEKDTIEWGTFEYADFYRTLNTLKHQNKALWNGAAGGLIQRIPTGKDEAVYAFTREKDGDKVLVILNLSSDKQAIKLEGDSYVGDYSNVFANETKKLMEDMTMNLKPWDYLVFSNK